MRRSTALLCVLGLFGCDEDDAQQALQQASADLQNVAASARSALGLARIGGTVVPSDGLMVEVLPRQDGYVEALVVGPDGEVVETAEVQVQLQGDDGNMHPTTLRWDPGEGRYVGRVEAGVEVAVAGPVDVAVTKDGESHRGHAAKLAAAPAAASHGGTVVVAGDFSAEVIAKPDGTVTAYVAGPEGEVRGAGPTVEVSLKGQDGALHPVELDWDAQAGAYVGRPAAEVSWQPGPMQLAVVVDGRRRDTRVEHVPLAPPPAHEGSVVVAGDYTVEVVPADEEGQLKAYVLDDGGAPVQAGAEVHVVVGPERRPATLVWSADAGAFVGDVDARIDVAAAPVGVVVVRGGRRHRGAITVTHARPLRRWHRRRVRVAASMPPLPPHHPPAVGLRAQGRVPGPGASLMVRGPGGRVSIMAPGGSIMVRGPGVSIMGPSVMGSLRVRGPRPPRGSAMVRVRGPGGSARVSVMAGRGMSRGMRRGMR